MESGLETDFAHELEKARNIAILKATESLAAAIPSTVHAIESQLAMLDQLIALISGKDQ